MKKKKKQTHLLHESELNTLSYNQTLLKFSCLISDSITIQQDQKNPKKE